MNKKGQTAIVGIMIAFALITAVIVMIEPLKDQITTARTTLDCTNTSLSAGQAGTCIVVDSSLFLYVGIGIAVALGFIGVKKFGGISEG